MLTADSIAELLQPYLEPTAGAATVDAPDWAQIYRQLAVYLELILRWNARINLTAIRTPEEIVRRHFGESLFTGMRLGACATLLDFGSGAGFPGVPIQLLRPDIAVTLAESRSRKAAFLREVVRTLGLRSEVWADRVESMPVERRFDVVAMRAVDSMEAAMLEGGRRASERMLILGTVRSPVIAGLASFRVGEPIPLPQSDEGVLWMAVR